MTWQVGESRDCDLCRKPVEPGQPRFGGRGSGDKSGAPMGFDRHYSCHIERFGKPLSSSSFEELHKLRRAAAELRDAAEPARERKKRPVALKGEYNRSANAARPFETLRRIEEHGRTRVEIECPFCATTFWAFVWSLSGGGKRCPTCRAKHASFGLAYPLVGNEDI